MRSDGGELLNRIVEMDAGELEDFIQEECDERGIKFDPDDLDGEDKLQAMYDFIADNLYPDLQGELHSECQLRPGCAMFPETENEEELNEEIEHLLH